MFGSMVFELGCDVLANRLFVWLDHVRYVIITKRLMAYAGPSSNGRTLVFGTSYVGSNPAGPAIFLRTKPPSGGFLLYCRVQRIRTDEVKSRNRQKAYSALPCRGDPPIAKTKIPTFLQLFCDWGLLFRSRKAEISRK